MNFYFLNLDPTDNPNNDNEVHASGCIWMPAEYKRISLGYFANGIQAVRRARELGYYNVDGCKTCCPEAHKS